MTPANRDWHEQLLRTVLFVPGNDQRKLAKAGKVGADLVVIDLEDAVAESEKTTARVITRDALPGVAATASVAVRVNGLDSGRLEEDIASVVGPELTAIVVPKVQALAGLEIADRALASAERDGRLTPGAIGLLALIETPLGIARCEEILLGAPARTATAMFGVADFSAALGVELSPEGDELLYARSRLIVAARAAGLPAPVDGPYLNVENAEGLLADSRRSRGLGFQGRAAIHPRQVGPMNRAFSELSPEELESSRRIVEAFAAAEAGGVASIRVGPRFVDYPVYELARARLHRHEAYVQAEKS